MLQYVSVSPDVLAADLVGLFDRYIAHAVQASGQDDRRGMAKHLAIVATVLRATGDLDMSTALRLTARAYGEHFQPPPSTLKKCASEARALLAAREERKAPDLRAGAPWEAFAEIDAQVALESAQAATALRAARLSGRRGGRPFRSSAPKRPVPEATVPPERIARAIVSLKERARAGDESARFSLEKLTRLIAQ